MLDIWTITQSRAKQARSAISDALGAMPGISEVEENLFLFSLGGQSHHVIMGEWWNSRHSTFRACRESVRVQIPALLPFGKTQLRLSSVDRGREPLARAGTVAPRRSGPALLPVWQANSTAMRLKPAAFAGANPATGTIAGWFTRNSRRDRLKSGQPWGCDSPPRDHLHKSVFSG